MSLEDTEPEPLIKREKGKWNGLELFNLNIAAPSNVKQTTTTLVSPPPISATINTVKTTLAHKHCSDNALLCHQVRQKEIDILK